MGRKKQSGTERSRSGNGANLGFEEKLWAAADKMRGHMDASEYKHVALGLIFLKYISDAFQERYDEIKKEPHVGDGVRLSSWFLRAVFETKSRVEVWRGGLGPA